MCFQFGFMGANKTNGCTLFLGWAIAQALCFLSQTDQKTAKSPAYKSAGGRYRKVERLYCWISFW